MPAPGIVDSSVKFFPIWTESKHVIAHSIFCGPVVRLRLLHFTITTCHVNWYAISKSINVFHCRLPILNQWCPFLYFHTTWPWNLWSIVGLKATTNWGPEIINDHVRRRRINKFPYCLFYVSILICYVQTRYKKCSLQTILDHMYVFTRWMKHDTLVSGGSLQKLITSTVFSTYNLGRLEVIPPLHTHCVIRSVVCSTVLLYQGTYCTINVWRYSSTPKIFCLRSHPGSRIPESRIQILHNWKFHVCRKI